MIVEGYQVGLAHFYLSKSLLPTPDPLPVLDRFENSFQNYLLHHFPQDKGEAVWSVVP